MNPKARVLTIAGVLLAAAATPAGAQPAECGNWRGAGFSDGSRGVPDAFLARKRACDGLPGQIIGATRRAAYASPAYDAYSEGYAAGLALYCTSVNGYRVGRRNEAYQGVCPEDAEGGFRAAWRRGLGDWAEAEGHPGFWLDGAYVSLSGAAGGPPVDPPPRPRAVAWDETGGGPESLAAGFREDRDWRELWRRTPVAEPETPVAAPPPPVPAPAPRIDPFDDDHVDVFIFDRDDRGHRRRPPRRKPRPEPPEPPAARPDLRGDAGDAPERRLR